MADLKIRVFKGGDDQPATTVTIPGGVLRIAASFIPARAVAALNAEIARLSESPDAKGTLAEIEDHEKGEKVVISLE
jgi:hypothetical protein